MIVLGIDSATDRLGVGLADPQRVLADELLESSQEHASRLIGLIDTVLSGTALSKKEIQGVAVSVGPGSFTGLRVGMAAAKGLAMGLGVPIVGISTFEIVAQRLQAELAVFYLTAIVRRGEYYLCRVEEDVVIPGGILTVSENDLVTAVGNSPVGMIGRAPEGWAAMVANPIAPERLLVSAGRLAQMGAGRISAGIVDDLATLQPLYLVPSQAERKFGRK
jgi:tRNA threonylcarbamoyladenosine biosynthesis protein TsaB